MQEGVLKFFLQKKDINLWRILTFRTGDTPIHLTEDKSLKSSHLMKPILFTLAGVLISICSFAQISAITGTTSTCPGGTTTLSDATSGGTWTSSAPSIATIGATTGIVTAISVGTTTITYTVGASYVTTSYIVSPTPSVDTILGGGSYCTGGTGVNINLSGSTVGSTYQLYIGGSTTVGAPIVGTGSSVDFGFQTTAGVYTVIANPGTACAVNMYGSVTVSTLPLPNAYAVTGGGSGCVGGGGFHVILSFSDPGVIYQLAAGGTMIGAAVAGMGSPIDFGPQTMTGTYTVIGTNATTGCTNNMSGSATIMYLATPYPYSVIGGGGYCTGGSGVHIGLAASEPVVSYQLMHGTTPMGPALLGTGSALDFGLQTVTGVYIVIAHSTISGCTDTMADSVTVLTGPALTTYTLTSSGSGCGAGTHVLLSGSQAGITYQLYNGPAAVGLPVAGTGSPLDFGPQIYNGAYTAVAYSVPGCYTNMTGTATVTNDPVIYSMTGGGVYCTGGAGVHIGLNNSQTGVTYYLYLGTTMMGTLSGTGSSLDFGLETATGTYLVGAYNTATGCTDTMAGTDTVSVGTPPPSFTVTGGGPSCPGSHIGLSGSTAGGVYELFRDGNTTGLVLTGTGSALDFGIFSMPGVYTVTGRVGTSCTLIMSSSATISSSLTAYNVSGGGPYCTGGPSPHVYLSGSHTGITYKMYDGNGVLASTMAGTGSALDFGTYTAPGFYSVTASDSAGGCIISMNGVAKIEIAPGTCSGTPYAGDAWPYNWNTTICNGSPLSLFLTGPVPCGTTFQWQSSPDNITWTTIPGATVFTYTSLPTTTLYYRCIVTCVSSGLTATSAPVQIKVTNRIINSYAWVSDTACSAANFYLSTCTGDTSYHVRTWFGDGSSDYAHLFTYSASFVYQHHNYSLPGTYTVKQVLYDTIGPVDSVSYSFASTYCKILQLQFYNDTNNNCVKDAGEISPQFPIRVAIDTNGVPLDTIVVTSGLYYYAFGRPGTIYGFRPVALPGMHIGCPSGGVIFDTISSLINIYPVKYFGLQCNTTSAFDLSLGASTWPYSHNYQAMISVTNTYCNAATANVTMHFSPNYQFGYSSPSPTSVSGNTVTWNLGSLGSDRKIIWVWCTVPGTGFLIPGVDTVHTDFKVSVVTGETDTTNNYISRIETIWGSYDPNEMSVSPAGDIISCTPLQYTIHFQNTGNDTAHNVYILDTLSDNLDPKSLDIVSASAEMNTGIFKSGTHTIVKFDFPNIKLLDSSHHGKDEGAVTFTIKAKPGLADGALIKNTAGIFFDDNPAILTNTIQNIIGIDAIAGLNTVCVSAHDTLTNATIGGVWSCTNPHASVVDGLVTGISAGTDTVKYTVSNSCATKTATKIITVNPLAVAGTITGASTVCAGSSVTLVDTVTGGIWSSSTPAVATVSTGGLTTGTSAGTVTISYTRTNVCGSAFATKPLTVNPLPTAYNVTGGGNYCSGLPGEHVYISNSETGINYQMLVGGTPIGSATAGSGAGIDFGLFTTAGTYSVRATNATTGCVKNMTGSAVITVTPSVVPAISMTSDASSTICTGTLVTFTATTTNEGSTPAINWTVNGVPSGSGSVFSYTPANSDQVAVKLTSSAPCAIPDTAIAQQMMSVTPVMIPAVSMTAYPGTTISPGETETLYATVSGCAGTPSYQWLINSMPVPGATNSTFTSNALYNNDSVSCTVNCSGPCGKQSFNAVIIHVYDVSVHSPAAQFSHVAIYPNPNNGVFAIKGMITSGENELSITISDLLGQTVYSQIVPVHNGTIDAQLSLDGQLARGVYMLTMRDGDGSRVVRLVVE